MTAMDNFEALQSRLGMTDNLQRISSKAKELVRLCSLRFEAGLGVVSGRLYVALMPIAHVILAPQSGHKRKACMSQSITSIVALLASARDIHQWQHWPLTGLTRIIECRFCP